MTKLLVVGWDGATWSALKTWVDQGLMPNLKKMMDRGVWGNLESVIPPVSPVAWPSFATGCNPGRHGVYGFQQFKEKGSLEKIIPLSFNIKEPTLWKILSDNGYKSVVMNIQLTYPPEKIDGVIVSGVMAPETTAHPKEIQKWLIEEDYVVEGLGYMDTPKDKFVENLYSVTDKRVETALKLMDKVEWDLFTILISGTDRIQHYLWGDMDANGKFKDAIKDYYTYLDGLLGKLLEKSQADVRIVMSDHGFCHQRNRVHINHYLEDKGYLSTFDDNQNRKARKMIRISGFLKQSGISKIIIRLMQLIGKKPGKISPPNIRVDYDNTKAYTCGYYTGQVYLSNNLTKIEYEKLQDELIEKIPVELVDPKTGKSVVEKIWRKQDIYHGSQIENGPDILILPKDGYWITGGFSYPSLIEKITKESGRHHLQGMYVMEDGKNRRGEIRDARLIDLAPSILKLFGLKSDMDGIDFFTYTTKP